MGFEEMHKEWFEKHLKSRTGERKRRLQLGHHHGERLFLKLVWWPIFGHFENLHPEYEVIDWRGAPYFVDFVWLHGHCKFAFEIKGYGPHVQHTDRVRYRRELDRETFLQTLGYRVVSIPYDNLEENPNLSVYLLKSLLAPYITEVQTGKEYTFLEREVLFLALRFSTPIRPIDLVKELRINQRTAVKCLKSLCEKGKLRPILTAKKMRVTRYELVPSFSWFW